MTGFLQAGLALVLVDWNFFIRFLLLGFLLLFFATVFSLFQKERRVPSLKRMADEMVDVWNRFPMVLGHRLKTVPYRAKKSFSHKKYSLYHSVSKKLVNRLSKPKGKSGKNRLYSWVEKHSLPLEKSFLFRVRSKKHEKYTIADALLEHPNQTLFILEPDKIVKRYSVGKWSVYSLIQGPAKIFAVSRKKLSKKIRAHLFKTKNGFLAVCE